MLRKRAKNRSKAPAVAVIWLWRAAACAALDPRAVGAEGQVPGPAGRSVELPTRPLLHLQHCFSLRTSSHSQKCITSP